MKTKALKIFRITLFIAITAISWQGFSQTPPPPPGGSSGSENNSNNRNGGGAPIGGGLLILVALGAGYGAKKVYDYRKRNLAE